jgi:hypothetical protein
MGHDEMAAMCDACADQCLRCLDEMRNGSMEECMLCAQMCAECGEKCATVDEATHRTCAGACARCAEECGRMAVPAGKSAMML